MLTAIVYNCEPESLGDVTPEAFVDAFENEVYAVPRYRETRVRVTFDTAKSGLASVSVDEGQPDPTIYAEEFQAIAERAFAACLSGE